MNDESNWFEIPVRDLERALSCYETLLATRLRRMETRGLPYAVFPHEERGISGALVQDPKRSPGGSAIVYLHVVGPLDAILSRAEEAKARVVLPKVNIGKGFLAILVDTEGNRIGISAT